MKSLKSDILSDNMESNELMKGGIEIKKMAVKL